MAMQGGPRILVLVLTWLLLLVSLDQNVNLGVTDTVSASSTWVQTDSIDFMDGEFSKVEVVEQEGEAYLRLERSSEWANVTPAASPPPRRGHTMVYDEGVEATVLFGGVSETGYFNDTWLYFSGNNTWVEVHPPSGPSPREGHAVAYDSESDLMWMVGGFDGKDYLSDTWLYSPKNNIWDELPLDPLSPVPPERAWSAMSYDKAARYALLYGGLSSSRYLSDTWMFDTQQCFWTQLFPAASPGERHSHSMAYDDPLGQHLLTGGYSQGEQQSDTWAFDTSTGSWLYVRATSVPPPLANHSLTYDSLNGELFLFGGYGSTKPDDEDRFSSLPCDIPEGDSTTTMLEHDGHLYIGTANAADHSYIHRLDQSTGICEKWKDTGVYYVYSSASYGGVAFWGSRWRSGSARGDLFYYDGTTFDSIPGDVWFSSRNISGWIEDFHVFGNRLFASGTIMTYPPENSNNFFVKYCDNPPCLDASDWHWTDTSAGNLGKIDDGAELHEFKGDLYLATYDPASILRYHPSNNTWWFSLGGSVDGDTPGLKGGYGVFGLTEYEGYLHALTYRNGWHWRTQDGISWTGVNESFEIFTRAFVFEDRIYIGATDVNGNHLASWNGSSWSKSSIDNEIIRYFANCGDDLCFTAGNHVYKGVLRRNNLWKYLPEQDFWAEVSDASPPSDRERFGLTFDSLNNILVLFGGADGSGYHGDTHIFDMALDEGIFTSAIFDSGNSSIEVRWESISWSMRSLPSGSSIRFQIATNNGNSTWNFTGPDGTNASYYDDPLGQGIWSGHHGDRYLRFRAHFTAVFPIGPVLDGVEIAYDHPSPGFTWFELAIYLCAVPVVFLAVIVLVIRYWERRSKETEEELEPDSGEDSRP